MKTEKQQLNEKIELKFKEAQLIMDELFALMNDDTERAKRKELTSKLGKLNSEVSKMIKTLKKS